MSTLLAGDARAVSDWDLGHRGVGLCTAAPTDYGVTGIKSFIVSHDGVVYEKDLGSKSVETFRSMERYNPDKSWSPVTSP